MDQFKRKGRRKASGVSDREVQVSLTNPDMNLRRTSTNKPEGTRERSPRGRERLPEPGRGAGDTGPQCRPGRARGASPEHAQGREDLTLHFVPRAQATCPSTSVPPTSASQASSGRLAQAHNGRRGSGRGPRGSAPASSCSEWTWPAPLLPNILNRLAKSPCPPPQFPQVYLGCIVG